MLNLALVIGGGLTSDSAIATPMQCYQGVIQVTAFQSQKKPTDIDRLMKTKSITPKYT